MTQAAPIIAVRDLYRSFAEVEAVRGISFDIHRGEVVGFIGANGAGKTTTMRIMATLEPPTSGAVEICGYDIMNFPGAVRGKIGWMPDTFGAYPNMTVAEYLDFYGRAFGYESARRGERLREVMEFTDLNVISERPMNKLSKGMGQRLCLGRTLMHDPEALIMDEPAAGLDPKARIEFKRLVRLLAEQGKTIFISSHILSELGEMCDSLIFIDAGRVVHQGTAAELQGDAKGPVVVEIRLDGGPAKLREWAERTPGVRLVEMLENKALVDLGEETPGLVSGVLQKMIADGLPVSDFHRRTRKLEDAFVDLLKKLEAPQP